MQFCDGDPVLFALFASGILLLIIGGGLWGSGEASDEDGRMIVGIVLIGVATFLFVIGCLAFMWKLHRRIQKQKEIEDQLKSFQQQVIETEERRSIKVDMNGSTHASPRRAPTQGSDADVLPWTETSRDGNVSITTMNRPLDHLSIDEEENPSDSLSPPMANNSVENGYESNSHDLELLPMTKIKDNNERVCEEITPVDGCTDVPQTSDRNSSTTTLTEIDNSNHADAHTHIRINGSISSPVHLTDGSSTPCINGNQVKLDVSNASSSATDNSNIMTIKL